MDDKVCCEFIDLVPQNVPYRYEPIKPGWIRIFDLLNKPGDNGPLQCRLRQVRLPQSKVRNTEDDFNALSYVWDSHRQRFEMQVLPAGNGSGPSMTTGKIPLTESLYNALRDLRDCEHIQPKTFWIDQICIDQSNDKERSRQVSQMGKVFQFATSVWTYLGPREDTDDEALDLMTQICEHFESVSRTHPELALLLTSPMDIYFLSDNWGKYACQTAETIESDVLFPENLFEGEGSILYYNLSRIIFGPWIYRLWLFQENVLNDDLTFFRGHRMLRLDVLQLICNVSYVGLVPYYPEIRNVIETRSARRHRDENGWGLLLRNLIRITNDLSCRDARDRIYAVLGVATDAEQMKIYPDYSISAAQAFTNLSVTFTKQKLDEGSHVFLEELHCTDVRMPAKQPYSGMPTWVPKYLDDGYRRPCETGFDLFKTMGKHQENRTFWNNLISFESSRFVTNGVMVVKGIRLELNLDRSLGTFAGPALTSFTNTQDLNQSLATLETFFEHTNGSQCLVSHFLEAFAFGGRIFVSTIDSADQEAAVAKAFSDVLQLLKQARSGNVIPMKQLDVFNLPILTLPGGQKGLAYLLLVAMYTLGNRSLWISKEQHICVAPNRLQEQDIAVVLLGGKYIYFLRPVGDKFEYIGWGSVSGFMNGEALVDGWEDKVETFKLI